MTLLHVLSYGAALLAFLFLTLSLAELVEEYTVLTKKIIKNVTLYFTSVYFVFVDIAAFFGICVWLIPFSYFISLSANDNALPSFDTKSYNIDLIPARNKSGLLKNLLNFILQKKEEIIPLTSASQSSNLSTRKNL
ncbi:62_t:CDS:2 [Funneliformis mosseae]|uniref:62_t:CDS:1 n=1 Tax=Funneliformis mosseae TaxID=27381 RepID=A0A9N8YT21_FUNMO|nr:62_t:CDS:2 [Funneliformis mosseae]